MIQAEALRLLTEKGFEATNDRGNCRSGGCRPSYVLPLLTGAAFRVANRSVAFTERGQYGDRQPRSGSPGALPRRGPLRPCVPAFQAHGSSKPRRFAGRLSSWPLRCTAGGLPTRAVGVHEAECGGFVWAQ